MNTKHYLGLFGVIVVACTIANLIALKIAADIAAKQIKEQSETPTGKALTTLGGLL